MPSYFGYEYKAEPLAVPYVKAKDGSLSVKPPKFLVDEIKPDFLLDEKGKPTGETVGLVTGQKDLVQEIQSQKDLCGLSYILSQVENGRVNPSSLVDDVRINGDKGGDFTNPTMTAEAFQVMVQDAGSKAKLDMIAAQLGVTTDELIKCNDIDGLIRSKLAPKQTEVSQPKAEEGDK